MTQPIDTYFPLQWHLQNNGQTGGLPSVDLNVLPAWVYYRGSGVRIGVYDNGTFVLHPDLIGNWDPGLQPIVDGKPWDPNPLNFEFGNGGFGPVGAHGTTVAGLIIAGWNGFGVVGVSPGARFGAAFAYGRRGLGQDETELLNKAVLEQYKQLNLFDVTNHSYGSSLPFTKFIILSSEAKEYKPLFEEASRTGRDGLGSVQVISAGNDRVEGSYTPGDLLTNLRQNIIVAAGSDFGDIIAYSTPGPSLLVTAPVDVNRPLEQTFEFQDREIFKSTTTDIPGIFNGYTGSGDPIDLDSSFGPDFSYTSLMNGTSAAAPMVSGVVALMLEANPALGYRDVQDILAISARQPWQQGEFELYPWRTNGAQTINGGGFRYSHDYGFGFVDAAAAVRLAESWQHQRTAANELQVTSGVINLDAPIPADNTTPFRFDIAIDLDITVEWLELQTSFDHSHWGDLTFTLTSPSGSNHILLDRIGRSPEFAFIIEPNNPWVELYGNTGSAGGILDSNEDYSKMEWFSQLNWPFTSTVSRGESSSGTWTLSINGLSPEQGGVGGAGVLQDVELRLYGRPTAGSPGAEQPSLYFTDSYASLLALEPERASGYSATTPVALNAAASSLDLRVDLSQGTATLGDDPILWDQTTIVDTVFGGAGNDVITGSARNERIDGGWGDDLIIYGGGNDIWRGGFGADAFRFDAGQLNASVFTDGPTRVEILDFTAGLDRIELTSGASGQFRLSAIDGNIAQLLWSAPTSGFVFPFSRPATGVVELVNASGAWDSSQFVFA